MNLNGKTIACLRCGTSFYVRPSRRALFCSRDCYKQTQAVKSAIGDEHAFWLRIDVRGSDECWPWKKARMPTGYGRVHYEGRIRFSHHVAFKLKRGSWPDYLRHSCDNPPCCNPTHLLEGTPLENSADMVARSRQARGERLPFSKLTENQIRAIRADRRTQKKIADDYGIDRSQVSRIRSLKNWGHIK